MYKYPLRAKGISGLVFIVLILSACSSGGAGSGTTSQLIVSAGADQSVDGAQSVVLQAGSNSPIAPSYHWSLLEAPSASMLASSDINGVNQARASFTPDVVGAYVFQVEANVAGKQASDKTTVTVDHIWKVLGTAGISAQLLSDDISLTVAPDGTLYMAFADASSNRAHVVKYDISSSRWVAVGNAGLLSAGPNPGANFISIAVAPDGTPYIAYQHGTNGPVAVDEYDSGTLQWKSISSGLSSDGATYVSIAIAPDGTPYVAYKDTINGTVVVERYDSASGGWTGGSVPDATTGGNPIYIVFTSIAVASDGTPYVAYENSNQLATVEKYDKNTPTWSLVGQAGFSPGVVSYLSIDIGPDDVPYVAFQDANKGHGATVMKYDSSARVWTAVGDRGFSPHMAGKISLTISPSGSPYVAYGDVTNGDATGKLTVKKYDTGVNPSAWVNVGSSDFSANDATVATSVVVSQDGTPYVGYANGASYVTTVAHLTTIAPQVLAIHPGNGVLGVESTGTKISVRFDRAMNQGTLTGSTGRDNISLKDSTGPVSVTSLSYDGSTHTLTFQPASKLSGVVTVSLNNGIEDSNGNAFGGMTWSFKVQ